MTLDPARDPAAATPQPERRDREACLADALADLVQQIDINDYRDGLGHPLHNNQAYLRAQAIADDYGLDHEGIRDALAACDGDLARAARDLTARRRARPSDAPPEYRTWTTGP